MKKFLSVLLVALAPSTAMLANASTVNVLSSNGTFAGNSADALTTVVELSNEQMSANLSDGDMASYFFGSDIDGQTNASLTLEFTSSIANTSGDDFAFYFMGGSEEINNISVCFTSNCTPDTSAPLTAAFSTDYHVIIDGVNFALSAVSIDLSDYNFAENELLGEFTIDLLAGGYNRLAGIESFAADIPTTVVPVPAAFWLFASGLGLLGLLKRKAR